LNRDGFIEIAEALIFVQWLGSAVEVNNRDFVPAVPSRQGFKSEDAIRAQGTRGGLAGKRSRLVGLVAPIVA